MIALEILLVPLAIAGFIVALVANARAGTLARKVDELEKRLRAIDARPAPARTLAAEAAAPRDPLGLPASLPEPLFVAPLVSRAELAETTQSATAREIDDFAPVESRPASAVAAAFRAEPDSTDAASSTSESVERALGLVWATRIGAILLLLGVLFFFKVAIERNWLGPWARVGLGVLAGTSCAGLAASFRRRLAAGWVGAMVGLGLAILLASVWAAYSLYQLLPGWVAFLALTLFAVGAGALAVAWRLETVLVTASSAGYLTLATLSGSFPGHAVFMLYGAALGIAVLVTAVPRSWSLAALSVPLGIIPALISRHFGPPELLYREFGGALPMPGGVDTAVALALAFLLAAAFIIAARRLFAERFLPDALAVSAVVLPLGLGAMLLDGVVALGALVAAMALVVSVMRWRFETPHADATTAAAPLPALHLALHALGGLALVVGVVITRERPTTFDLAPVLAFVLIGLTSAFAASGRDLGTELSILAGTALAWAGIHGDVRELDAHAVAVSIAAAVALILGLLRRGSNHEVRMTGASAAVALLVLAIARAQLPPTLTTLALAAIVLALAVVSRLGERRLLWLAMTVLSLGAFVFLAINARIPDEQRASFLSSMGARGAYFVTPLIGPRGLPLLALAAVALAFRSVAAPRAERGSGLLAAIRIAGFVLALGYCLDQAYLLMEMAATPDGAFALRDLDAVARLRAIHPSDDASVVLTAVLALFGGVVLAWGFIARSRLDRWVGLVAIGLGLVKLVTADLVIMDSVARTVVLVSFGALLLASGFLYARFAPRLKSLLSRDDAIPGG